MAHDYIDSVDEEDKLYLYNGTTFEPSTIKIGDRQDAVTIGKTQTVALDNMTPDVPRRNDKLDNLVTLVKPENKYLNLFDKYENGFSSKLPTLNRHSTFPFLNAEPQLSVDEVNELKAENRHLNALATDVANYRDAVESAPELITQNSRTKFPHLAWEAVNAGLAKEKITNTQLNSHIKDAEKIQKDIDILLDLSAELTALKDDINEFPQKVKDILGQLKERGIDIWKVEGNEVSKEKISELKSLSSAQVDKLRSNLQIIFTTKIQTLVQNIGAILECIKDMVRNNTKLINAANRLPGH